MKNRKDLIFLLTLLLLIAVFALLPPSGKMALLKEGCFALILWITAIYLVWALYRVPEAKTKFVKAVRVLFLFLWVLISVLGSKNLVSDLMNGTERIVLYKPAVSKDQGMTGIFSQYGYMWGEDAEGNFHKIKISGKDYEVLQKYRPEEIEIEYYEETERLVWYHF